MANNTTENEGITRPVAAVSSTSSLDSFVASLPQHSSREESAISPSISQQSLKSPAIPPGNDSVQNGSNQSVNNAVRVQAPVVRTLAVVPTVSSVPIVPSSTSVTSVVGVPSKSAPANNSVAEFLYQLTKMLTDDNREVIEWSNSKIEVHNPYKLASEVLPKYFRHSKFASFQRQLNYFGFRKLAGKGRMAPCSYVNDAATTELRSLLLIKRKTTPATVREKGTKKRERTDSVSDSLAASTSTINPVLAGILHRATSTTDGDIHETPKVVTGKGIKHELNGFLRNPAGAGAPSNNSHLAIARSVVGKGIRHGYSNVAASLAKSSANAVTAVATEATAIPCFTFQEPDQLGMDMQSSLSELSNNFKNSLRDGQQGFGMLSRDSSLVDLAMLDSVEPTPVSEMKGTSDQHFMPFVDFPHSSQEFDLSPHG